MQLRKFFVRLGWGEAILLVLALTGLAAEPGLPLPDSTEVSTLRPGSVLLYPYYTSSSANAQQNTRITVTNTSLTQAGVLHLFFIVGSNGSAADSYICLTPNQTAVFLASDVDPDSTGYMVFVSVDENGCPNNNNVFTGQGFVKLASGQQAALVAEAVPAVAASPADCTGGQGAVLNFDGVNYGRLARTLALDKLRSPVDGNATLLILNRLGGSLSSGAASLGTIEGIVSNQNAEQYPFSFLSGSAQFTQTFSNTFPSLSQPLNNVLASGMAGWVRLASAQDGGMFGAALSFNPNTAANSRAFAGGRTLRKLALATSASLTIPVFPPVC